MWQDPYTLLAIAGAICGILILWNIRLEMKMKRMLRGKNAKTLEDTIVSLDQDIKKLKDYANKNELRMSKVDHKLAETISNFAVLRYNPFKGTGSGGNQSFVAAFLNDKKDGLVISSLYSRDRVSVFSKAIKNGGSDFELSAEEKEAIGLAIKS